MPTTTPRSRIRVLTRPLRRAVVFAAVWWVVAEADPEGWVFGIPFVALATGASLALTPTREWRIRPVGALRYAGYFIQQSVLGGIDVSMRAIKPSLPIDPLILRYRMRLVPEYARVLFADTVSLLPGTLSSGFEDDTMTLHVLDCELDVEQSLRDVEERVADVFGLDLSVGGGELAAIDGGAVGEYR
ncbi:MAG: Na+/H+ antiporter subunit E [Anaerosomatales bacterium]|nr:Na+/H+ antiporter subunit E [Anaerosomatales bacterium]